MFLSRLKPPNLRKCLGITWECRAAHLTTDEKHSRALEKHSHAQEGGVIPKKDVSKAMRAYLERAQAHNEFMDEKRREFQIGRRHLANMMGEDPETFTQDDINRSIEYLFPSGLFDPKARPLMRPPEEVYPQRKAAEFDETGRPYHYLFYSGKPNFYQLLYDIVENMAELEKYEDKMIKKNIHEDPNTKLDISGYKWIEKELLEQKLVEKIHDKEYSYFVNAMERFSQKPYAFRHKEFFLKYSQSLMSQTKVLDTPKLQYDETGRAYITIYECLRKRARAHVTLRSPGEGLISINGEDISYFKDAQSREQILFPLLFTGMVNKLDIEAQVEGGGYSGQAGAIRWGISQGLRCFITEEMIEQMRIAGLLTRDYRTRERMKPGQSGARRKYTWKKR